ncbi:PREDICTED: uncharacterized protein LOC109468327 [Branchiostoma belcheri]|uniref:Uncharacterized protein LOC109468327 n=1 Tax=Branchiostoma belcheri TaxID=7741 RepID=A0A6P4YXY3_BRABE|nr:PREDICTED: uncharacterized protein LOC109468327 [Branchiostoma belcheri]
MKLSIIITVITTALILAGKNTCYGQVCEPIRYSGCMGLSYNQTSFPNVYGWQDQDEALRTAPFVFPTYNPIIDCHPELNFFLCSLLFPQCTSEGQKLPCRSFCNEINATCGERALAAGVQWNAAICPQLSDDSCTRPDGCEPIRYSGCMGLSYSQTSFPNVYGWQDQDEALRTAPFVFPTLPCRSFCNEINTACGDRAQAAGLQWNAAICPQLSDDSCTRPNVPSIITSPATPSQQSNATATTAPTVSQQANTTATDAPTASQLANTTATDAPTASQLANKTVTDAPTSSQQTNTTATDAPTTGSQQDNTPTVGASGGAMATGGNADIVIGVVAAIAWAVALGNSG